MVVSFEKSTVVPTKDRDDHIVIIRVESFF